MRDERFVVDQPRPRPGAPTGQPAATPVHTLHTMRGNIELRSAEGQTLGSLTRGESALVPVTLGNYRLTTADGDTEAVMVTVPATRP